MRPRFRFASSLALAGGVLVAGFAQPARAGDPTMSDCIQANENALKLRAQHKLRQARAQWVVCSAASCDPEIRDTCAQHVAEVNAAIPTIAFEVTDAAGNGLAAVKVAMDGEPLVDRLEGTAVSLDPGEHTFTFTAEALPPVEKKLIIIEGVKERHEKIVLGTAAPTPSPTPSPTPTPSPSPTPAPTATPPEPPPASAHWSGMKTAAFVVGGLGAAGLVVGSIFGVDAFSKWSSAQSDCRSATSCTDHAQALTDRDSASSAATVSTAAFIAGGVVLAAGAALYLLAPRSPEGTSVALAPSAGPGGAGILVKGAFR